MKLKDIIYIVIILLIIGFGANILSGQQAKLKQTRESYAAELSAEKNKYIRLDRYMSRRLDMYAAKVARMSDSLKIKPRYIQDVVEVEITRTDTVRDTVKIQAPPPDFTWETFSITDNCMTVAGIAPCDVIFTEKSYRDSLFLFKHETRRRLFGWNWTPKWGRKEIDITTHSNCSDIEVIWREMVE